MNDVLESLDLSQYLPAALDWATNILLAIVILILGYWIAGRVARLIVGMGDRYAKLDSTLFTFLGSIARYVVLAFTFIAVLNRFCVETTCKIRPTRSIKQSDISSKRGPECVRTARFGC